MPHIVVILNPTADRGHASRTAARLRKQVNARAEANTPPAAVQWMETQYPRHAIALAEEAGLAGADLVVAAGGDGTVHEVVNGLMRLDPTQRPVLGIIPVGSGNDFAHNIDLPQDATAAIECLFSGHSRPVDVGTITDEEGRLEYWNNTMGMGFTGAVNYATRQLKALRGFLIYLVAVLRSTFITPPRHTATLTLGEGEEPFTQPLNMLMVANGPREGGGFPIAPNAEVDDGLLTYTIMVQTGRLGILRYLPVVMAGNHLEHGHIFINGHTDSIRVAFDAPLHVHIDGEIYNTPDDAHTFEIGVVPGALRVACRP